ncbi:MAG: hypothetical protein OEU92_08060 [Alphaproteobacteria bacterium]|nr:hypothetical protein [Alphaproteobacteria bacterium]
MIGQGIFPLLVSAGILLGANGMIGTLAAVRASIEGFPDASIGLMGTAYFPGFFGGCVATARLIARVGHILVFSALCAWRLDRPVRLFTDYRSLWRPCFLSLHSKPARPVRAVRSLSDDETRQRSDCSAFSLCRPSPHVACDFPAVSIEWRWRMTDMMEAGEITRSEVSEVK